MEIVIKIKREKEQNRKKNISLVVDIFLTLYIIHGRTRRTQNNITAGVITISQTFIIYRKYTRSQQQHNNNTKQSK